MLPFSLTFSFRWAANLTQGAESVGEVSTCRKGREKVTMALFSKSSQKVGLDNMPSYSHSTCVVHGLQQLSDQNLILRLILLQ